MREFLLRKGQITVITALISTGGMLVAAAITGWFSASSRVSAIERNVAVIEERENNHYGEVQKQLLNVTKQLEKISDKLGVGK